MLSGKAVLILLFSITFSFSSLAKPLSFAATHYPPYTIVPEVGGISGLDTDVVRAAFAQQNIQIDVVSPPWARALKSVQHGKYAGLMSCTKNKQRSDYLYYSDPISEINNGLITKANHSLTQVNHLDDLVGLKLIAIRKWSTQTELESRGIAHTAVDTIPQALNMLIMRDFDAIYSGVESISYYAKQANLTSEIDVVYFPGLPAKKLHMCLGKKTPNASTLLQQFNRGLAAIKVNGQFDAIANKYALAGRTL